MSMHEECSIDFLDCRGYYDLAAQIIAVIVAIFILMRALGNYKELKVQSSLTSEVQYTSNINLKMRINSLNIAFLLLFIGHLVFSMVLFQFINESQVGRKVEDVRKDDLQYWYKFSNILMIEMGNVLVVAIGWLYWGIVSSFYKIKGLKAPKIYHNRVRYAVIFGLAIMVGITIVSFVEVVFDDTQLDVVLNWLVLGSELVATVYFVGFRMIYFRNIFSAVKMRKRAVQRQNIYNFIIILSSFGRVVVCILNAIDLDFQKLRKYEDLHCQDVLPYHAMVILPIRVLIDLLPAFVFTRIFGGLNQRNNNPLEQTLFSAVQTDSKSQTSAI